MNWHCKTCDFVARRRSELLKHYRLKHGHCGRTQSVPCLHSDCPCSFKSWSTLRTHLSRYHVPSTTSNQLRPFTCLVCRSHGFQTERQYFEHIGSHLKRFETVSCVFQDCDHTTNIYRTFFSHKSKKHTPHTHEDFKRSVFQDDQCQLFDEREEDESNFDSVFVEEEEDIRKTICDRLGCLFLKLDSIFNVSKTCLNYIIEELHFIISAASGPAIKEILLSTLQKHGCNIDDSVVSELVTNICQQNPASSALAADGPFSTSYKRSVFLKEHFSIVEPVEYILDDKEHKTFQYVPILPMLSRLLDNKDIQDNVFHRRTYSEAYYRSFHDGSHFRDNHFLSGDDTKLSLILFVDDFEVCNPLGTSRRKHKITAVYWVLGDIPATLRSTLSSIFLAVLCRADDVKRYGYSKVLEPLLRDLKVLEDEGISVACLDKNLKGTAFCVVADNLGAHSIGGFVESFSASHYCRFCTAERSEVQSHAVNAGIFPLRTKHDHSLHVEKALNNSTHGHCFGVKSQCAISDRLSFFHAISGYPPDVMHDLLEGIVPLELGLCLNSLIKKKFFTLEELNHSIRQFPYKWSDKTNCPQAVPLDLASRRSIGGNAHENWCLLRLLPFMVGRKVPEDDLVWQVIMTLKEVVELVMAPVHTDYTIGCLESKIGEHRHRFLEVFPEEKIIPKHHFLEHYPWLITAFGPVVALWTMRFEGKHSFFKKIVRQTGSFRNILKTMAEKHQAMTAHNLHDSNFLKPTLTVSKVSRVAVEVLRGDIKESIARKFPNEPAGMSRPAQLRVLIKDGDVRKLTLPCGIPETVETLRAIIQETFQLDGDFSVMYEDKDFGNEYFTLTSTADINDKSTIKIVKVESTVTLTFSPIAESELMSSTPRSSQDTPQCTEVQHSTDDALSSSSRDTEILPDSCRSDPWPLHFEIPKFSRDVELILQEANKLYHMNGTLFSDTRVKAAIRHTLSDAIFQYTAYPKDHHIIQVVQALVEKFPCLKEPGSFSGMYGWQQSLKTRMSNFRRMLKSRQVSCPEIEVNFLKRKSSANQAPAKNLKRPRRAEVNYLPPCPVGETQESLEKERLDLLYEVKKKHNERIIAAKMDKTFAVRRLEVVHDGPSVQDFMARWPALFQEDQVKKEFRRITAIPLESTFLDKLDSYTPQLLSVMRTKGGVAGTKIRPMLDTLCQVLLVQFSFVNVMLCFSLIKENDQSSQSQAMKILLVYSQDDPVDVALAIDGAEVLSKCRNKTNACILLMGLIYALNLEYPSQLKNTFDFFQKVILELDPKRLLNKVQTLKNKLLA
ncbi:hypothetical protein ACEWY4_010661 [Coilia grayii]|uniref:C2H2-type domain-containing protein n=1 Tax=Coilia grayii TaxID=363190 RepID=A0ABD1K2J9_9TELE